MRTITIDERLEDHEGDLVKAFNDIWAELLRRIRQECFTIDAGSARWSFAETVQGRRVRLEVKVTPA